MPLLEREGLLDVVAGLLAQAGDGSGSLVLVAGEAGSGKTSLAREIRARAESRVLAMEGACDPLTTPRPLSPLVDIAADPEAGLDDLFDAETALDVFARVLDRLRTTIRPILLVIEDIHWADEGTLDFLRFVGRRVADTKAVVLCTFRDDEIGPDHPLRMVIGDLVPRATTHRLKVEALSIQAVEALLGESEFNATELHRLTGGNAFFVTEVLATASSLPESVQDAVLARTGRLSHEARKVVNAVSIAPRSLSVDLAHALSGAEPADVDEAVISGVLVQTNGDLRFRHELARSSVEDSLPPAQRLADHRRMIALLQEEETADLARLAHHATRAENGELVVELAPQAALQAESRGSYREAAAWYRSALEYSDLVEPDQAARWRIALGRSYRVLDQQLDALREQEMAVDHFRQTGATVDLANALVAVSTTRWSLSHLVEGRAAVDEAIGLLEPLGESSDLAHAWYCAGYHWMLARRRDESKDALEEASRIALAVEDEETGRLVDYIFGTTEVVMGDARKGISILEETYKKATNVGDEFLRIGALGMLGSGGGEVRLYQPAIDALNHAIEIASSHDLDSGVSYDWAWLARIHFEQGLWDQAVYYAERVMSGPPGRGVISPVTALGALGRVRVRRGDPGARQALEEALRIGANCEMQHVWSPLCGLAELAWLQGSTDEIPPILGDIFERALATDSPWARGEVGFWMWKAGAIDSPPDDAAEPFALQISGSWRQAADVWREIGCPYEVALALADGDEDSMLEAVAIFDSLGARPASQWLRSRLRDLGAQSIPRGPTEQTRSNPAGLTTRQVEVLGLMTLGLTNSEIAEKLFISKKTVEHHVSAIYGKLGVTTRAKAIAWAGESGAEK
jgi:DNA-binding CsgD family transcriptional regulator/tetratricopeptide (TPR) repeat protein